MIPTVSAFFGQSVWLLKGSTFEGEPSQ